PENTLKWLSPPRSQFASPMSSGGFVRGPREPAPAWSPAWHGDAVTASPEPTSRGEAAAGIRTGVGVFHAKFGEGRVLAVEGQGNDARAQVNFPRHGTKWLALSVAKLTVVD
ncbi:MAG: DNA helicase II, partial [Burkholderiaceae bacterium]